eukprot:CAMPEP_0201704800 /NCGR_PEP_ID=MMETSP0578-20130828/43957_1 /ASSEMBLY_ACC=CAM_ASM_000663 /TAXON_ID=267565 /ORGANISM="Skeletonema grethea, Strain CCMP 1804" /LENGTH=77 /DNA_ID=CAMNT_0048192905 /DNA_START=20 /DNA_END=253 /DNA_ORIENTATION=-
MNFLPISVNGLCFLVTLDMTLENTADADATAAEADVVPDDSRGDDVILVSGGGGDGTPLGRCPTLLVLFATRLPFRL